jgi:DNA helicase-2/ATP-dependent DNA helicase PcrA
MPEGEAAYEPEYDVVDERSIVDALDDLGHPDAYSAEGAARLRRLAAELRELRRWTTQPLPDLVAAVARAIGVEVEIGSRPGLRSGDAAVNLDRLVEVAEDFVESGEDPGLPAFLAYLSAAEEQEDGLAVDIGEPGAERVQIMTVHAAKGLEWDHVVVSGLTESVFPVTGRGVTDWTKQVASLPFALRGDRGELPEWAWASAADLAEAKNSLLAYREACKERFAVEERRLAYVAMTRPRTTLVCTGYWWDDAQKPRGPSELLLQAAEAARAGAGEVLVWTEPPEDNAANPVTSTQIVLPWPNDPLGSRRSDVERAAELVRVAMSAPDPDAGTVAEWREAADLLLAEIARRRPTGEREVELPHALSVTQLQLLHRDPAALARRLRRPMPQAPAPAARRGTRFHAWLEAHWGRAGLLDIDELPGSADEGAHVDDDLSALQAAFQESEWWGRTPTEVEVPFDLDLDGVLLRGRIDAVFTDARDAAGPLVDVVDWKTGRIPTDPDDVAARDVQLAAYRLAWHELTGAPVERIRAAFHYVRQGETVRPVDLLDRQALARLVSSVPAGVG